MKKCTKCNKQKPFDLFRRNSTQPDGHHGHCKMCSAEYHSGDGYTYVYYLPEEHYVGVTTSPVKRMNQHRNSQNHIVDGWEIIARFERRVDAHYLEIMFHMRGYQGFSKVGRKKYKEN